MTATLASLKEALQQPFSVDCIQFLPKDIHQENGNSVCSAFPYANKRVYEDRLNELVFGEWSTPYTEPYAQDNKLIIPATVVILGVAHTDYGEAFLTAVSKNGTTREDENTATEAYSQAFRRACSKFLLGRYLYDLPKLTLPYNTNTRQINLSKADRIAWVEKLYIMRGLLPKVVTVSQITEVVHTSGTTTMTPAQPISSSNKILSTSQSSKTVKASQQAVTTYSYQTRYPNDTFLDWVCRCVNRDPKRIEDICTTYKVADLSRLSTPQREALTKRLQQQATSPSSPTSLQAKR